MPRPRDQNIAILIFLVFVLFAIFHNYNWAIRSRESGSESKTSIKLEEVLQLSQDDPRITNYIKEHHLAPPISRDTPYNLQHPEATNAPFSDAIRILLNNLKGGFFIEAGTNDGEQLSTTLILERFDNWTGLCVEPSPILREIWRTKQRKAWLADVCLSTVPIPVGMDFIHKPDDPLGSRLGSKEETVGHPKWKLFKAPCFPLYSILKAMDVSVVDHLNFDVHAF